MPEKMQPNIQQTAVEKVLIKHHAMSAFRYAKRIEKQAQKQASAQVEQAHSEIEHIRHLAYQQGYHDGLKQLLSNMIESIELSEIRYQEKWKQSQEDLKQQLMTFFSDPRLQQIVTDHFIEQQPDTNQVILYLPDTFDKQCQQKNSHITISPSLDGEIAIEANNEIVYFSPSIAAQHVLTQMLSIQSRCQVLAERKAAYQDMVNLCGIGGKDDNNTSN